MAETDLTRRGALALMAGGLAAPAALAQPIYQLGHGFDPRSLAGAAAEHFAGLLAERAGGVVGDPPGQPARSQPRRG